MWWVLGWDLVVSRNVRLWRGDNLKPSGLAALRSWSSPTCGRCSWGGRRGFGPPCGRMADLCLLSNLWGSAAPPCCGKGTAAVPWLGICTPRTRQRWLPVSPAVQWGVSRSLRSESHRAVCVTEKWPTVHRWWWETDCPLQSCGMWRGDHASITGCWSCPRRRCRKRPAGWPLSPSVVREWLSETQPGLEVVQWVRLLCVRQPGCPYLWWRFVALRHPAVGDCPGRHARLRAACQSPKPLRDVEGVWVGLSGPSPPNVAATRPLQMPWPPRRHVWIEPSPPLGSATASVLRPPLLVAQCVEPMWAQMCSILACLKQWMAKYG